MPLDPSGPDAVPTGLDGLDGAIDLAVLGAWMDSAGLASGPICDVELLGGGTQNILLAFTRADRSYVLRRGPRHLRAASNRVIAREAEVLSALRGSAVPHPEVIAACPDPDVMGGAVFYLMEPVAGFNPIVGLPAAVAADATIRHRMGMSAVDALAALATVDYEAAGLSGFGRPDGFLERQVPRWLGELESYADLDGYPGPEIPGLDAVAAWLDANRPATFVPGIMHGDAHAGNMLFQASDGEVAALVDWEMSTIGDPLVDLGWLLATWPDPAFGPPVGPAAALAAHDGWAAVGELSERYARRSGRDVAAVDWYHTFACFKLGVILEGTYARACAGKAPKPTGDLLHAVTLALFARAVRVVGV